MTDKNTSASTSSAGIKITLRPFHLTTHLKAKGEVDSQGNETTRVVVEIPKDSLSVYDKAAEEFSMSREALLSKATKAYQNLIEDVLAFEREYPGRSYRIEPPKVIDVMKETEEEEARAYFRPHGFILH